MNLWGLLVIALGLAILTVGFVGSEQKIWNAITGPRAGGSGLGPSGLPLGASTGRRGAFA